MKSWLAGRLSKREKYLMLGLIGATFLPRRKTDAVTHLERDARYAYAVWMRHLSMARTHGLERHPKVVVELGPGPNLGVGIAALLTGAEQYIALDLTPTVELERQVPLVAQLAGLISARAPIPGPDEFAELLPTLESYEPGALATDAASQGRVDRILDTLTSSNGAPDAPIRYISPWSADSVPAASVDFVLSQAVMEHVDGLEESYNNMAGWLRPGGVASHQIDYRCHDVADEWNGHWAYRDLTWRIMRRGQSYLINRRPHSAQIDAIVSSGLRVVINETYMDRSGVGRPSLAPAFRSLSEPDLTTYSAFVQARRD